MVTGAGLKWQSHIGNISGSAIYGRNRARCVPWDPASYKEYRLGGKRPVGDLLIPYWTIAWILLETALWRYGNIWFFGLVMLD